MRKIKRAVCSTALVSNELHTHRIDCELLCMEILVVGFFIIYLINNFFINEVSIQAVVNPRLVNLLLKLRDVSIPECLGSLNILLGSNVLILNTFLCRTDIKATCLVINEVKLLCKFEKSVILTKTLLPRDVHRTLHVRLYNTVLNTKTTDSNTCHTLRTNGCFITCLTVCITLLNLYSGKL